MAVLLLFFRNYGYTPLWWYRSWAHLTVSAGEGTIFRFAIGYRTAMGVKKSKFTDMLFNKMPPVVAVLYGLLCTTLEMPFLVHPPGTGIGTYYGWSECMLLIIQIGTMAVLWIALIVNTFIIVMFLWKSNRSGVTTTTRQNPTRNRKRRRIIFKFVAFTIGMSFVILLFCFVYMQRLMVRWGKKYTVYYWGFDDIYPWKGIVLVTVAFPVLSVLG